MLCLDILEGSSSLRKAGLEAGSFHCVVTNPPFRDASASRRSPDPLRALAHMMDDALIDYWLRAAASLLRPKGALVMIHRADALPLLLSVLPKSLGDVALRFVHPKPGAPAIRLLLTAIKGSRAPLTVLPPLILHGEDGAFTALAVGVHDGTAALDR